MQINLKFSQGTQKSEKVERSKANWHISEVIVVFIVFSSEQQQKRSESHSAHYISQ